MSSAVESIVRTPTLWDKIRAIYELGKPNLSFQVVITAVLGFYLASSHLGGGGGWLVLTGLIIGTALTSFGACGLNMVLERDVDPQMTRTKNRPIPSGRLTPDEAGISATLSFGIGFFVLFVFCGWWPALLSLTTLVIYAFIYTPLKRMGPISIWVGAIPGAIPPVMGWSTVAGNIGWGGLALFLVLFAWQFPHFIALAYVYRVDYAKAGFRFLPTTDTEKTTGRNIFIGTIVLLLISLGPWILGLSSLFYLSGAVLAGVLFCFRGLQVAISCTPPRARKAFIASILYLPFLLGLILIDQLFVAGV